jgi:hypothetical protein
LALRALGIEEDEERAYHLLLMQHTTAIEEIAAKLSLSNRLPPVSGSDGNQDDAGIRISH